MKTATEEATMLEALRKLLTGWFGPPAEANVREANHLLDDPTAYEAMSRAHNPYGDGKAASRIREILLGIQRTNYRALSIKP